MAEKTEVLAPGGGELSYPLFERANMNNVLALIDENLDPQSFSILNLPRIRIPSGGALAFRVETAGGEESAAELKGIMAAWRPARVYFKKAYGRGGKKPPDCSSIDGRMGVGDPGGPCPDCPYARFGSAINADGSRGKGQACKEVRQVLLLLPGNILPHLVNIPPTSLPAFSQYTLALLNARASYWQTITSLKLERASNESGIEYARVHFRIAKRLEPPQQQAFEPYHLRMKEILKPSIVDASAYEIIDDEEPNEDDTPH